MMTYAIACNVPTIKQATIENLSTLDFRYDPKAQIMLVIDAPVGFALQALKPPTSTLQPFVVITWNPCVEYWDDVWELQPIIFVASDVQSIPTALTLAAAGTRRRLTPGGTSSLTNHERRILGLVAKGYSNQQIADELTMRCQSVRNTLTSIYEKVDVKDRSQAILYYWGINTSHKQYHE